MKKIVSALFVSVLLLFAAPVSAWAQSNVTSLSAELNYTDISNKLTKIEKSLKSNDVTSADLSEDVKYIAATRIDLLDIKKSIESSLRFVEKKLDALGPEPEDGKEVPLIAQKRREFKNEQSTEKARIAEVDILLARLDELDVSIFNLRNEELLGNLLIRVTPLAYPKEFLSSTSLFVGMIFDIIKSPVDWYSSLNQETRNLVKSKLIPVALVILFISWLGYYLRVFIIRRFGYRKDIEHPRYGKKVMAAIAVAIAYGVIPAFIIGSCLAWMVSTKVLDSGFLGTLLKSFLYYSLYVVMGRAVSRVIFAPYNEKWRLVNVDNSKAKRLTSAFYFSVTMIGIMSFLVHIVTVHNYPIELLTYMMAMSSAVKAFCIILITKRVLWDDIVVADSSAEETGSATLLPNDDQLSAASEDDEEINSDDNSFRLTFFISLFAFGSFVISLFGYPYLSAFILNRFLLSAVIVGVLMVIRKMFYEMLHRILLLRIWIKTFRMRRRIISKINFWSGLVIDPIFVLAGLFFILALWGVPTDVLNSLIYRLLTGFTVGGVRISLISIALGILSFFIVITLVKAMRRRLQDNVLSRMDIDDGVKHSLAAGFGFVGYVVATLLAIAIMGGSLTNFALVAGALSVGIGLGLQNIVNNFVSGIILLFERPIKVGDWVIINGEEGRIKQINIRSTEVETFKRASLIIPNANLLSTTVTNLTHSNNWARYAIQVGVAYGSDTQKVRDILLECASANKKVLRKPEPYVLFTDFGASSLNFELRVYVSDIWNGWIVPSDLRFEINRRFAEEGIEIPFNQLVVHQGSKVAEETESQFYASKKKKGKQDADK